MSSETTHKVNLRNLTIADYDAVRQISAKVYKGLSAPWTEKEISTLINRFGEGQIC